MVTFVTSLINNGLRRDGAPVQPDLRLSGIEKSNAGHELYIYHTPTRLSKVLNSLSFKNIYQKLVLVSRHDLPVVALSQCKLLRVGNVASSPDVVGSGAGGVR